MTCDKTQPLLEGFAGGELGWGMAWRVRRHLATCPACAAELAETRSLDSRVRAWRDVPAPAGLQSRIVAALPSAPPASVPRRPAVARRAAVGLAGVAAASAAFLWLLPGQPGRPTIAFADVEKAMASVNVMAWTTEVRHYGKDGILTEHHVSRTWMRRSPLAQATIVLPEPSHLQGSQTLEDERGFLEILPNGKGVVWRGRTNVFDTVAACTSLFTRPLRVLEQEHGAELERVTLNGQPALKATQSYMQKATLSYKQFEALTTIWIDPAKKQVIQLETKETSNGKLDYVVTETQMRYDETPPPGVFDIVPPGAKIKYLPERKKQSQTRP